MAGALQEPPVSSHKAQGANLAAVDAADPALLPAVRQKWNMDAPRYEHMASIWEPPVSSHKAQGANFAAVDAADPALLPAAQQNRTWMHQDTNTRPVCGSLLCLLTRPRVQTLQLLMLLTLHICLQYSKKRTCMHQDTNTRPVCGRLLGLHTRPRAKPCRC